MNIAFYITDHGFGHLMRNIPVIAELLERAGNKVIIVTAEKQMQLGMEYLRKNTALSDAELKERCTAVIQKLEVGTIVKSGSLEIDAPALKAEVEEYTGRFPNLIEGAENLFTECKIDKVVCDIVPWALTAAKNKKIPSVLMASFTWIEIYEEFLPERLIAPFRAAFADAGQVLFYELANEPTKKRFPGGIPAGLAARPFHMDKAVQIRKQFAQKPIVFISVGGSNDGINMHIDVSDLPYQFIVTSGLDLEGSNVYHLPVEVDNTQDYICASEYCISKAGWTTVAEMLLAGKKMALLKRPDVAEDRMTINTLLEQNRVLGIDVDELRDIGSILERLNSTPFKIQHYDNQKKEIADRLLEPVK